MRVEAIRLPVIGIVGLSACPYDAVEAVRKNYKREFLSMNSPKVSIIIPVYNGSNYLREAIESAIGQSYENCEVIVVNDGSDDGGLTESIALSYGDKIRYYRKKNGGVATALNWGIKVMKGEFFSWLSHDDLYSENKIEIQMNAILSEGQTSDIAYSDYILWYMENNKKVYSNYLNCLEQEQLNSGFFSIWLSKFRGCTLLIHKRHFERVGLFDENLKTTQDEDMWFRIFEEVDAVFVPIPLVTMRIHPEQGSRTILEYYEERVQLYRGYLDKVSRNKIDIVFGSEYRFYSLLLERFRYSELYECMEIAAGRLRKLAQPENIQEEIERFKEYLNKQLGGENKYIGIWGAGFRGKLILDKLRFRGLQVKAFIDSDIKKQGSVVEGIPCMSCYDIDWKNTGIIISMEDDEQISMAEEKLKELGAMRYTTYLKLEKQLMYTGISKDCIKFGVKNYS